MNFWLQFSQSTDYTCLAAPLYRAPLNHPDAFKSGLEKLGELIVFFPEMVVLSNLEGYCAEQANLSLSSGSAGFTGN